MEAPKVCEQSSPAVVAKEREEDEAVAAYVARFAGLPSRIRILPADGSLRPLLALAGYPGEEEEAEDKKKKKEQQNQNEDGEEEASGDVVNPPKKQCVLEGVVVGLDFDQTLVVGAGLKAGATGGGVQVRGGDDTVTALQTLWAAGARLAVVTATAASPDNARLIANLLRRLALAREFASAALDTAPLLTLLRSLAPPAAAAAAATAAADAAASTVDAATTEETTTTTTTTTTRPATADCEQAGEVKGEEVEKREERRKRLERETKRTVALLALSTGRRPGDLVRIGHSTIAFDAARSKATYRLAQITGTNAGGWSALQSLAAHEERELCAVDCLAAYMDLTASRRTREGANIPDRLLLSLDEEENGALDENAVSKLLEEVLVEAGINPQTPEARELFQDSAELVTLDGGVKIARYRHIMCARYNKPEALLDFVTRLGQAPPKKILFVDDNSDNVFNMFHFFASRQLEQLAAGRAVEETTSVISCWFPPPEGGKAEPHDPHLLALLRRMAAL